MEKYKVNVISISKNEMGHKISKKLKPKYIVAPDKETAQSIVTLMNKITTAHIYKLKSVVK